MSDISSLATELAPSGFVQRHIGPDEAQIAAMCQALDVDSVDALMAATVPEGIRSETTSALAPETSETDALATLAALAEDNQVWTSYIGMGYHDTVLPPVIQRNVLENPGWYTAYTPYQPEIAQGRLEGLLNFQHMISELTGMPLANASMLDEATAAAEAMAMAKRVQRKNRSERFFVDVDCHPQTLAVVRTRARYFGFEIVEGTPERIADCGPIFGALVQYTGSSGELRDLGAIIPAIHAAGALAIVAADIMSLVLLNPPGESGADVVIGSNQRFGIPLGFGGPHAAFFAFKEEHKRASPGRIIGVSKDARGKMALRMAMQTREQHIRREKANSNICTSQVLLALMSTFYAMYHGAEGLHRIALRIHSMTQLLAMQLEAQGLGLRHRHFFDTLRVDTQGKQHEMLARAEAAEINLRAFEDGDIGLSLNEATNLRDLETLAKVLLGQSIAFSHSGANFDAIPTSLQRQVRPLQHEVFNRYHSETEMLRYLKRLESKDIALNHAMIPLGSCTMKLNATAEMMPLSWPQFARLHPFAPAEQTQGYRRMFSELEAMLRACTGYDAISLQPNAGSQGEYAGLVAIKRYFDSRDEDQREICLIPASAHGTNPASAQMAGLKVVVTRCDAEGNVDIEDLREKVEEYGDRIAALMVTYPSTHGVFEEDIAAICALMHSIGAQVYIDGANMNALVGLAAPGVFGGDVSHLNLHKTFCIPHGGGGPGMGPIGVKSHLAPFLAGHPVVPVPDTHADNGTVSAAPWGSASILTISWMYIKMMGAEGMRRASEIAILNANYVAKRLAPHYPILYRGRNGFVAHECLLDLRPIKDVSGVTEEDIAKRLMDYGFHAPTMSFPVAGTLMIEPTESESLAELDRFCDAMIAIKTEIDKVIAGSWPRENNPLTNAPHSLDDVMAEHWDRPYSRETAARPLPYLALHKVWPSVNRIDNVYGDRHLICSCPPIESYGQM